MSGVETFTTSLLKNATGKTSSSFISILAKSVGVGLFSAFTGKVFGGTKIAGLTIGRNSYLAIFKSGLTKLVNSTASIMSNKAFMKSILSIKII